MLLPRNSNSWEGFLKIGDRGKPADGRTLQFALSFWIRQAPSCSDLKKAVQMQDHHMEEAMCLTDQVSSLVPWSYSCKANISGGCPLAMPRTIGPCKKCFRMPETKIKLQCYGDTSALTVAKYAISLKQWRNEGGGRNVLWFIYLFPVAVENFLRGEGRPETDPICQLWISINNEHNSIRVFK